MWFALFVSWGCVQDAGAPVEPWREGPLQNETVRATETAAQTEIERGDRAWSNSDQVSALEAWRRALETSATGDAVALLSSDPKDAHPWPDEERSAERRTEGVEYAVLRRLAAIGAEARAAWRARFSAAAELARTRAHENPAWLARVERDWPLTEAAGRAALVLADLALEADDAEGAGAWLERAARHAQEVSPALEAAVERRTLALTALAPGRASAQEKWTNARSLVPTGSVRLAGRRASERSPWELPLGRTIEPGWAFLDDGSLVIVAPLLLLRIASDGRTERFPTWPTLGLGEDLQPYFSPASAGWPLCATSDGTRCFWVEGRTNEDHDNALAALAFDRSGEPRVCWLLTAEGLSGADTGRCNPDPSSRAGASSCKLGSGAKPPTRARARASACGSAASIHGRGRCAGRARSADRPISCPISAVVPPRARSPPLPGCRSRARARASSWARTRASLHSSTPSTGGSRGRSRIGDAVRRTRAGRARGDRGSRPRPRGRGSSTGPPSIPTSRMRCARSRTSARECSP
jgi:hypothetical protein